MALISARTKEHARTLRDSQTDAERWLWSHLRRRQVNGWRFRRQHPIPPYIADFACIEAKLIVEADGGQHAEPSRDEIRDRNLKEAGWRILRFWNLDILKNMPSVIETVGAAH